MAQTRRRPNAPNSQQVSRSAPQASSSSGSQPVSLTMTTAAMDTKEGRQYSAGSNLSQLSRMAEEEKVEQLKNMSSLVNIKIEYLIYNYPTLYGIMIYLMA